MYHCATGGDVGLRNDRPGFDLEQSGSIPNHAMAPGVDVRERERLELQMVGGWMWVTVECR